MSEDATNTSLDSDVRIPTQRKSKSKGKGRFLFWLIVLLALSGGGAIAYLLYWENFIRNLPWNQQESEEILSALNPTDAREVQTQSDELLIRIESLESEISNLDRANDELLTLISNQSASGVQFVASSSEDVRLAEVEYLLRVAQQELALEIDFGRSSAALHNADRILSSLRNSAYDELRAAIGSNIASLNELSDLDVSSLYQRLVVLKSRVEGLARTLPEYVGGISGRQMETPSSTADERSLASRIGDFFSSVFVIRQHESGSVRPVLSEMQAELIEHRISLALDRAQVALLRRDRELFVASLDECSALVNEYIDQREDHSTEFRRELESLKAIEIGTDSKPDVERTVSLVQSLRHLETSAKVSE